MIYFSEVTLEEEAIINSLKKNLMLRESCRKILHQEIINKAVQDKNIIVSVDEIQAEADNLRRQKQLEQASDTIAWLKDELITPEDWEAGIYDHIAADKLAEFLFSEEVKKTFQQNQHKFEQVLLYQITVPNEKLAWEIFYKLEEEEISFYEAAHLYDFDQNRRLHCGCAGKLYRHDLKPDLAALAFSAKPGEIITPLKSEQGYDLIMIEEFIPAQLTDKMYKEFLQQMFQEWLSQELDYFLFNQK